MVPRDSLITSLVSRSPLEQSLAALKDLIAQANATGGAVLLNGDVPRQWIGLNVRDVGDTLKRWDKHVAALTVALSRTAASITHALIRDEGRIIGMLYLEGAQAFDRQRYGGYLEAFRAGIVAATTTVSPYADIAAVLRARSARGNDDELRQVTVQLLWQYEGNLARVARELGVTRRAVYKRLDRWGIPRTGRA